MASPKAWCPSRNEQSLPFAAVVVDANVLSLRYTGESWDNSVLRKPVWLLHFFDVGQNSFGTAPLTFSPANGAWPSLERACKAIFCHTAPLALLAFGGGVTVVRVNPSQINNALALPARL